MLVAMDIHHNNASCYAYAGPRYKEYGQFVGKWTYPVYVKQSHDDKVIAWWNFDKSVKLINLRYKKSGYVLYVTLRDDKQHKFYVAHSLNF